MRVLGLVGFLAASGFLAAGVLVTEVGTTARGVCLAGTALGVLLVVAYLALNGREVAEFLASRQFVYGGNVVLVILILAAIVVFLNLISARFYAAADWTRAGSFTLSSETRNLISSLPAEATIVTFYGETRPDERAHFERLRDLLDRYKRLSANVRVQVVDINDRAVVEPLAAKYGVTERNVLVVEYKGQKKVLREYDIFTTEGPPPMYPGMPQPKEVFKGEDAITAAIRGLVEEEPPVVMFTTGFGEGGIDSRQEPTGFALIAGDVRSSNMKCESLPMFGKSAIPDTCDVLVVAGPSKPYGATEVRAIRTFLEEREGKAVFLLEPGLDRDSERRRVALTGLEDLLSRFGVEAGRNWVVDLLGRLPMTDPVVFMAAGQAYERHPIMDALEGSTTLWSVVRSLTETDSHPGFRVAPLLRTSARSWAKADLGMTADPFVDLQYVEGTDVRGPITIGMAVTAEPEMPEMPGMPPPEGGMRLVVFGDSDFITNAEYNPSTANRDLFVNTLRWLSGRSASMGIAPKEVDEAFFSTSARQSTFVWVSSIGMAVLAVAAGVVVWIIRR